MENNLRPRTDRIFFASGDLVQLKHKLRNKPEMLVQSVDKTIIKSFTEENNKGTLLGITCIWFTDTGALQKHRFNTKDIEKIDSDD
jgi:hypothetical protein